jgi:hypothetical protein
MDEITTTDLAEFGFRELHEAGNLLKAYASKGLDGFEHNEVRVMFNKNSGNVFLTNSEYQVAMMNGNDLELFYSCPECGHEGFKDEINHDEYSADCAEWVKTIKDGKL